MTYGERKVTARWNNCDCIKKIAMRVIRRLQVCTLSVDDGRLYTLLWKNIPNGRDESDVL
jgi:hypothetical protein